ncbi:unnamed protein product [Schistocephalus solidus]|uniref:C2H2-type domain-containing protein n=1 Tax=Schistocephalus solidus TaxID=70667 RepID=A0A183T409_SCHSO|nr:unnamed protein product [Schistocephalus solidus]
MARQDPGHGSPGADRNPQHPRHAEASATAMERPPGKNGRRATTQTTFFTEMSLRVLAGREVKNNATRTLKKSLKQLQINTATCLDLAHDRPAWRRSVKTGLAIYEVNRIAVAKAKRATRKSPAPWTKIVNAQALPTCPRCQRIFRARIGLVEHLRTQCTNNPTIPISTSNSADPPSDSPTLTHGINSITPTIIETISLYSSPVTPTTTTISDGESLLSCPQSDRTFTSHIGLVGHLRIHRTETGEPVPGAITHSRDRRLHYPHCPCAFNHRMGLFGHLRTQDS